MSKHIFYYRMFISKFVLEQGGVPLNPFMLFDYFLLDAVDRNLVRHANNVCVRRSDELWVFGPISDGVLIEVKLAEEDKKPIRYFAIDYKTGIAECAKEALEAEPDAALSWNLMIDADRRDATKP